MTVPAISKTLYAPARWAETPAVGPFTLRQVNIRWTPAGAVAEARRTVLETVEDMATALERRNAAPTKHTARTYDFVECVDAEGFGVMLMDLALSQMGREAFDAAVSDVTIPF